SSTCFFFFSSRRRHTRFSRDWSSDVCSSDLDQAATNLQDVLRNSPGITMGAGEGGRAGGDLPIIRGQNAAGSIFVDGVRDPSTRSEERRVGKEGSARGGPCR